MKDVGLKSLIRVKKYVYDRGEQWEIAPNHLNRNFKAIRPNQKWVTDITEFKVKDKKLYLTPIMDLHNWEIISFKLTDRPILKPVLDMVKRQQKINSVPKEPYSIPTNDGTIKTRSISKS